MVLWPQIIDAVAPTPVLAAGGIGTGRQIAAAMAMGAQGAWTGSIWLTVEEAECPPAQKESYLDATSAGHRALALVHRQALPHAAQRLDRGLGRRDTPDPLGMPLQNMVTMDAVVRTTATPTPESQAVAFNPVGQIVGMMNDVAVASGT